MIKNISSPVREESVLDLDDTLEVELKNDNVQSCSTRYDETIIAMLKQQTTEFWKMCIVVSFNHQNSSIHCSRSTWRIQFQKGESRDYTGVQKMVVVRYLEKDIRELLFS